MASLLTSLTDKRPSGGFRVIYADPAWNFDNYSENGELKNANQHYACMSIEDIKSLPVEAVAARDCLLFIWVTDPFLKESFDVIDSWGFTYKTVAFTWKKVRPSGAEFMGCGYYTRANPEMCLLATRGSPGGPADRGIRQLQEWPVREHSRKPDEIRTAIEIMYPDCQRLEMFARTAKEGWTAWGNETEKFS